MEKDPQIFLGHILDSIALIEKRIENVTLEEFVASIDLQDMINRRLEIIGEAVKKLPESFKEKNSNIPWAKAMATRNILIHNYTGIKLEIVWDTIKISLPEFKKQIEELDKPQK